MIGAKKLFVVALIVAGMSIPDTIWATTMSESLSTCGTDNCLARRIDGTIFGTGGGSAYPWVGEVWSEPGACLRLEVTAQPDDLEIVVTAPDGTVYRDDDGDVGGGTEPLVKIASTPDRGWYTVRVAKYNGSAVTGTFTMFYGTYNVGNPNCAGATPPLEPALDAPEPEKLEEGG